MKILSYLIIFLLCSWQLASASITSQTASEIIEQAVKRFGYKLGKETAETLTDKLVQLSAKYGDDAIAAVTKAGPKVFRLAEEAGEHSGAVVKLFAKYGEDATLLCEKTHCLNLFTKYGDDAAKAMIKHGDNAEVLIQQYGNLAAGALAKIEQREGRRLMQMSESGELTKIGGADKILAIVEKYGNKGMNFIWENKGALAIGAVALSFYNNPEPYIDGLQKLSATVIESTGKEIIQPTLNKMNGVVLTVIVAILLVLIFRKRLWKLIVSK
jgi:hypothetical protein